MGQNADRLRGLVLFAVLAAGLNGARSQEAAHLPRTQPLRETGDLSKQMVAGIQRVLVRATTESVAGRKRFWKRDLSSGQAYEKSIESNRQTLRRILGAVDQRIVPVRLTYDSGPDRSAVVAESATIRVLAVRWPVFEGVEGEGLLLEPKGPVVARIVALPDADQLPEVLCGLATEKDSAPKFAWRLAEAGCQVIVPMLIDRQCTWSGNPDVAMTDEPHREWVWRPAYELGRHVIGFEVQKVEAAIDWLRSQNKPDRPLPVGVVGYGEGGVIALYAAALDRRINAVLVSGSFDTREALWTEPIYRNVFGLLREFGDAEVASLIAPRTLIIEHSLGPSVDGPPAAAGKRRKSAAPGRLAPPKWASVQTEVERARALIMPPDGKPLAAVDLIAGENGTVVGPGSDEALDLLLKRLGVAPALRNELFVSKTAASLKTMGLRDPEERQQRQVHQLIEHCQRLLRGSEQRRAAFWRVSVPTSAEAWPDAPRRYRELFWKEHLGRLPDPSLPANPRSRLLDRRDAWTTWEVTLEVWPNVFAWGYLLVPGDITPNERRPVVVCQHGLEGLPGSTTNEDRDSRDWRAYRAFAHQLAARGFVVYAPHNPYRGETSFRQLQRLAHPLGFTLFSFIVGQHQQTLQWLQSLEFVDGQRIGFYGLSYGGVSALRIPAVLDGYALSICSAAFNDWPRKVVSNEFRAAYVFTREYDHFSFDLANTFGNAELAGLIAPRPFMVERGHSDAVAPDEWVASEYSKVRRLYARLGIPERTEIQFFPGGHQIQGRGTFAFLHRHLRWPEPTTVRKNANRTLPDRHQHQSRGVADTNVAGRGGRR